MFPFRSTASLAAAVLTATLATAQQPTANLGPVTNVRTEKSVGRFTETTSFDGVSVRKKSTTVTPTLGTRMKNLFRAVTLRDVPDRPDPEMIHRTVTFPQPPYSPPRLQSSFTTPKAGAPIPPATMPTAPANSIPLPTVVPPGIPMTMPSPTDEPPLVPKLANPSSPN